MYVVCLPGFMFSKTGKKVSVLYCTSFLRLFFLNFLFYSTTSTQKVRLCLRSNLKYTEAGWGCFTQRKLYHPRKQCLWWEDCFGVIHLSIHPEYLLHFFYSNLVHGCIRRKKYWHMLLFVIVERGLWLFYVFCSCRQNIAFYQLFLDRMTDSLEINIWIYFEMKMCFDLSVGFKLQSFYSSYFPFLIFCDLLL